jgi:hypothetical protein
VDEVNEAASREVWKTSMYLRKNGLLSLLSEDFREGILIFFFPPGGNSRTRQLLIVFSKVLDRQKPTSAVVFDQTRVRSPPHPPIP